MIAQLIDGVPRRVLILLGVLLAALVLAPLVASDYLLTVLIVILYFAYIGQAWNIMMGFAGQLSLGHALYVGLGAYTAAALYVHFGIGPWLGLLVGGAGGGAGRRLHRLSRLPFPRRRRLFRHPHHRGRRIRPRRLRSSGLDRRHRRLFLPVAQYAHNDLWHLRGHPVMFYYILLAATALAFLGCRALLQSRIGYFWLAIREDEEAARSVGIDTFRYKMVAVVISAAMTAFAGVIYRLLLQQPVSRAGLPHLALDRDHPRADRRRRRHAVRPDPRRLRADRAGRDADRRARGSRRRHARRQAGVLRHLPADGRRGAAGRHLAVAGAAARPRARAANERAARRR